MTRESYIQHLERGEIGNILFHFYSQRCTELDLNALEPMKFLTVFSHWQPSDWYAQRVIESYNVKFEVTIIEQKGKKTIYL